MKTQSLTFDVSDVIRAVEPLEEVSYREAIDCFMSRPLRSRIRNLQRQIAWPDESRFASTVERDESLAQLEQQLALLERVEAANPGGIECSSRYRGKLLRSVTGNPVIDALFQSFNTHRPFCLSPDMIWLLITQGVAHHINLHAEELRSRFVKHEGQVQIEVRCDGFFKGSPENPWHEVIDSFSQRIREHIGSTHDLFVPQFSTTTQTERIVAELVLLDAMHNYFRYVSNGYCGIPEITLEGTVEDWDLLADRAQAFAEFGLEWWLAPLQPVLRELAATAGGQVRTEFWRSIYKFDSFSGGSAITGWIVAFFPYLYGNDGKPTKRNPWLAETGGKLNRLLAAEWDEKEFDPDGPSPAVLPFGLSRVPFLWQNGIRQFNMEFLGGFVGVAQDELTLTLRPEIGWAVREVIP